MQQRASTRVRRQHRTLATKPRERTVNNNRANLADRQSHNSPLLDYRQRLYCIKTRRRRVSTVTSVKIQTAAEYPIMYFFRKQNFQTQRIQFTTTQMKTSSKTNNEDKQNMYDDRPVQTAPGN